MPVFSVIYELIIDTFMGHWEYDTIWDLCIYTYKNRNLKIQDL